jgi:hypothetical protein
MLRRCPRCRTRPNAKGGRSSPSPSALPSGSRGDEVAWMTGSLRFSATRRLYGSGAPHVKSRGVPQPPLFPARVLEELGSAGSDGARVEPGNGRSVGESEVHARAADLPDLGGGEHFVRAEPRALEAKIADREARHADRATHRERRIERLWREVERGRRLPGCAISVGGEHEGRERREGARLLVLHRRVGQGAEHERASLPRGERDLGRRAS